MPDINNKSIRYSYYEDGRREIFSMRDVYRMFKTKVDNNQKANGTIFQSWLSEMEKLQILIKCRRGS